MRQPMKMSEKRGKNETSFNADVDNYIGVKNIQNFLIASLVDTKDDSRQAKGT